MTETEAEAETETESRTDRVRVIARARVIVKYGFKVCPVVKYTDGFSLTIRIKCGFQTGEFLCAAVACRKVSETVVEVA